MYILYRIYIELESTKRSKYHASNFQLPNQVYFFVAAASVVANFPLCVVPDCLCIFFLHCIVCLSVSLLYELYVQTEFRFADEVICHGLSKFQMNCVRTSGSKHCLSESKRPVQCSSRSSIT